MKKIRTLNIGGTNTDISNTVIRQYGETRTFVIQGDPGAIFSLTIVDDDNCDVLAEPLENVVIPESGEYSFAQVFPAVKTKKEYDVTIRFGGGSILAGNIPTEVPTYKIKQYVNPTITLTSTTEDPYGGNVSYSGSDVTLEGIALKDADSISNGFTADTFGRITYTKTATSTGVLLYAAKVPKFKDDYTNNLDISRVTATTTNNNCQLVINPFEGDTTDLEVGMNFTGETVFTKRLVEVIGSTNCRKPSKKLRLNSIDGLEIGMVVEGKGIDTAITIVNIENGTDIVMSRPQYVRRYTDLTFKKRHAGTITKVINSGNILVEPMQSIPKGTKITFEIDETSIDGEIRTTGSGTTTVSVISKMAVRNFGKEDVSYTLDMDNIVVNIPNAYDQDVVIEKETATQIDLQLFDKDANKTSKTMSIVTNPSFGTLGSVAEGKVTYTPHNGFLGDDYFTFKATATKDSETKTIYITVVNSI